MYLKSIEVNGFKSFANKIIFQFDHGITGIVGPNGSGKSNVADAVRWVLGEQSAKQLRGAKMEDVIFSGTELRKPQGFAYVAITMDNSDHRLPIDYEEVTIARRVYRSGESEYLINGSPSRLKDVNALFFDTGIGKEGYSIIGQGQIEKILSGKPEERRELFDEAAGIVKYKRNKLATEKELESERANLSRVTDIIKELERQVGPLKEQSETARKYLQLKEELKKLDVNSFLLEVDHAKQQLTDYQEKLSIVENDANRLKEQFAFTKTEYEKIEANLETLSQKMDETKNSIHDKKLENERFDGEIKVVSEQISSAKKSEADIQLQMERLAESLRRSRNELEELYEKKNTMDEELDSADDILEEAKQESENILQEIADDEAAIEQAKGDIIEFLNEGGTLKAKVGRYDTMLENISYRKTELNQKLLSAKSDEMLQKEEYSRQQAALQTTEEAVKKNNSALSACEDSLRINIDRNNSVKSELSKLNQQIISLKSKQEALRNLTERYDGYGNSIRRIMEQKESNRKIIGVVADILNVEKKYETAIETALGGNIQNIVVEDEETAKKMIVFLKQNKAGRATFLPISSVTARNTVNPEVLKETGVIGTASQLVNADKKYKNIIESLLARSIVVDHIDNAILLAKKYKQTLRLVTLEGELINPGGAMTGGTFKNSSNLLGRKRELEDIAKEIGKTEEKYRRLQQEEAELKMKRDSLREQKEKYSEVLQRLSLDQNTISLRLGQLDTSLKQITDSYQSIRKENEELEAQIREINNNKEELYASTKEQESAIKNREQRIAELEIAVEEKKQKQKAKEEGISELVLNFNTIKQQVDFIVENIKRIKAEENRFLETEKDLKERLSHAGSEAASLTKTIEGLKEKIKANQTLIEKEEETLNAFQTEKEEMNRTHKDFFAKREELSEQINGLDKSAYRLNTAIEKVNEQSENLNAYMWEEYELTYNRAQEFRNVDMQDAAALKKNITSVKNQIRLLGDVNVNAIEDYKAVSERYEFLKAQHEDIVNAEANLVNIINELDRAMKETFAEKFKEIRIMFSKVFRELFGGGKADLELVDDSNLLETGIIINAQPPGKKLQNMMQLSGGEKSLTAISLLFAIQSLKPSPFCLLDEIEAALDDSNVKRFARYLERLTKETQYIVITHRKGTMEAANVLYGITMQEKGVSTLVSVNMIEESLN